MVEITGKMFNASDISHVPIINGDLPYNTYYTGPSPKYLELQNKYKGDSVRVAVDSIKDKGDSTCVAVDSIKDKQQAVLVLEKVIVKLDELVHNIKILQQAISQLKD